MFVYLLGSLNTQMSWWSALDACLDSLPVQGHHYREQNLIWEVKFEIVFLFYFELYYKIAIISLYIAEHEWYFGVSLIPFVVENGLDIFDLL